MLLDDKKYDRCKLSIKLNILYQVFFKILFLTKLITLLMIRKFCKIIFYYTKYHLWKKLLFIWLTF